MTSTRLTVLTVLTSLALSIAACRGAGEAGEPDHQAMSHDQPQHHMGQASEKPASAFDEAPPPGTMAVCPVTKNEFAVTAATASSVFEDKTYVFCCPGCKPRFDADPHQFL